jgi:hypothetical protein
MFTACFGPSSALVIALVETVSTPSWHVTCDRKQCVIACMHPACIVHWCWVEATDMMGIIRRTGEQRLPLRGQKMGLTGVAWWCGVERFYHWHDIVGVDASLAEPTYV